jgi:hypothetical protein
MGKRQEEYVESVVKTPFAQDERSKNKLAYCCKDPVDRKKW